MRQSVVSKFWLSVWTVGMSEIHRMKQWVSSVLWFVEFRQSVKFW